MPVSRVVERSYVTRHVLCRRFDDLPENCLRLVNYNQWFDGV